MTKQNKQKSFGKERPFQNKSDTTLQPDRVEKNPSFNVEELFGADDVVDLFNNRDDPTGTGIVEE